MVAGEQAMYDTRVYTTIVLVVMYMKARSMIESAKILIRHKLSDMFLVDPRGYEITSSLSSMVLGFVLLLPYDTFASSSAYYSMNIVMPEWLWGTITMIAGLIQFIVCLIGCDKKRSYSAQFMFTWWGFFSGTLVYQNPVSTEWVYCVFSVINIIAYRLHMIDIKFVVRIKG